MTSRFINYTNCPICSSLDISIFESVRDTLCLFKCSVCKIIFRNSYQGGSSYGYDELTFNNWKNESSKKFFDADFSSIDFISLKESYREALLPLEGPAASGKVLDLGCGGGLFLRLLNELKYDASGLEPSALFRSFGVDVLGLRIIDGDIYNYQGSQKFDTVIMNSVLEHLDQPISALREIRDKVIVKGGHLILTVPNISSLEYLTEGANWHNFNEDHLWYFSEPSIKFALEKAGFTSIRFMRHEYELSSNMQNIRHFISNFLDVSFNPFGGLSISAR
jgi:SAM-dependent methyltransferase